MSSFFNKQSLIFLEKYLNSNSPVGYEHNSQRIWKSYINKYIDDCIVDSYGTVVGVINPNNSYKVILEAHADEISWYVNYISEDGFIYVAYNGGSDKYIALSREVLIHTQNHLIVKGVFGAKAIHLRTGDDSKNISLDNIFIDVGVNSKEDVLNLGIAIGDVITYATNFFTLNNSYFVSKALDNKIGGFIIAEVLKKIVENNINLPFGLYIVNSVQEEVGLRGAQMITDKLKPDLAIITDVTHDTSVPIVNKKLLGDIKCGLGPVINHAPAIHNILRKNIINIANNMKIPFQQLCCSRYTGTDTDAFAYSNGGVVSALISTPLRYMHTTVEMVNKDDIEKTIELIFHVISHINPFENYKCI
jgi:putative aminopeptidase FrvX